MVRTRREPAQQNPPTAKTIRKTIRRPTTQAAGTAIVFFMARRSECPRVGIQRRLPQAERVSQQLGLEQPPTRRLESRLREPEREPDLLGRGLVPERKGAALRLEEGGKQGLSAGLELGQRAGWTPAHVELPVVAESFDETGEHVAEGCGLAAAVLRKVASLRAIRREEERKQ